MIDAPERTQDIQDMPLKEWRCSGRREDGRDCNNVLQEWASTGRIKFRKRCDKCKAWNTILL